MPDGNVTAPKQADAKAAEQTRRTLAFDQIVRSSLNPRKHFDPAAIAELAEGIAKVGLLQNLTVRPHPKQPGKFELISGETRHRAIEKLIAEKRAAADAQWPVVVVQVDDLTALTMSIAENTQRKNLTPLEEAEGFKKAIGMGGTTKDLAAATGMTIRNVQLRLALLADLTPKVQAALRDGRISLEHARELTKAPAKRQDSILDRIVPPGKKIDDPDDAFSYEDIVTAEHLKAELRRDCVPARVALFDPKLYKGKATVDPDDGEKFFEDPDEFAKLQKAAIEAKGKELAKAWPAGVEFVGDHDWNAEQLAKGELPHGWKKASNETIAAGKAAALFGAHDGRFVVVEGVVKASDRAETHDALPGVPQPKKIAGAAAPAKPEEIPVSAAREALVVRTHALQTAVAADVNHAKRLVVLALLGESDIARIKGDSRDAMGFSGSMIPAPAVDDALKAFAKLGIKENLDGEKLWAAIMTLGPNQLDRLFANLVASNVSVESNYANDCWPETDELAIARSVKANPALNFQIGEEFLGRLKKGQLLRIVADLKLEGDPRFAKGAAALTGTVIRKIILDAGDKLKGYVPVWCRFVPEAEMKAALKATPKIDATEAKKTIAAVAKEKPAATAKATAKPKPAPKPKGKAPAKAKSKSKGK